MSFPASLEDAGEMHLLCGIDDSAPGRNAAYVAGALARRLDATLTLLHAVGGGTAVAESRSDIRGAPVRVRAASARLARARTTFSVIANDVAAQTGARVSLRIESGDPVACLAAATEELAGDMVIIGHTRRSRLADLLVGEVHGRLVQRAQVPVVVVPAGAALPRPDRIVLACRRSASPQRAARLAGRLAAQLHASVVVTQVLPARRRDHRPTSWEVYDAARRDGDAAMDAAGMKVGIEYAEHEGHPAATLARVAEELDAALVVVGDRTRSPWRRLLWPSVASQVARRAQHPVIVVPDVEPVAGAAREVTDDGRVTAGARVIGRRAMPQR
jgi:nucleotide-binding universal stress UspA family protein